MQGRAKEIEEKGPPMSRYVLNIPSELRDPYFFTNEKVEIDGSQIVPWDPFFAFEILHFNGVSLKRLPWFVQGEWIEDIVREWREEGEYLEKVFKSRSKKTKESMKKSIGQFYMFLFWSNKQPANLNEWESKVNRLAIKPVNAVERITFIRENSSHYHAYIQLAQLFEEQHKQYAKFLALKQASIK
jgi:hypothetical protein